MCSKTKLKVLLTGGSRGIGKATADLFREHGHYVYCPSRKEMDLSDISSVQNFIKCHNECYDVLINNAGINEISVMGEVPEYEFTETCNVNLISPFLLANNYVKKMKNNGFGRIVNIASIWSVTYKEGRGSYCTTKHGIHGLTIALATDCGKFGVISNTVSPGFTKTDLTVKNNSPEQIDEISSTIPLRRMAEVDEIAKVIYFLGSTENTYINGQNIVVDGGFSIQ